MSRVAITDLVPGEEATSADVNATIASWNAAAGAGDIGPNNVRQEGIDRRTLSQSGQAIQAPPSLYANQVYSSATTTTGNTSVAYTWVPLAANMQIGPMTDLSSSSSETVVVRASVWLSAAQGATVEMIIQSSTDAVTWVSYDESYQAFVAQIYGVDIWRCTATYTSVVATTPSGSRVYWRVGYRTTAGSTTFGFGTLYIEEYAR